ncbi:MAG: hypothetical protein QOE29_1149, partial [Gaiellaceae bacterium]|nr:hypothetical protein [Gaiellaceae bacterium]
MVSEAASRLSRTGLLGRAPVRIMAAATALLLSGAFAGTIWRYENAQQDAREGLSDRGDRIRDQQAASAFWHEREAIDEYLITGAPETLKEIGLQRSEFSRLAALVSTTDEDFAPLVAATRANDLLMNE